MTRARPILRWVGGKAWLAPRVVDALGSGEPDRLYVEPFAGSLAVLFERYNRRDGEPEACVVSDRLGILVATYREIAFDPDGFTDALEALPREAWSEAYDEIRDRFNASAIDGYTTERAAAFVWLNRTGFNGVCRFNRSGGYNVPKGSFSKSGPSFPTRDEIRAVSRALSATTFVSGDFSEVALDRPSRLVDVYLDPPYVPKGGSFVGYTGEGFGEDDHRRLAKWAGDLARDGANVVVSNHATDFVREVYPEPDFEVVGYPTRGNSVSRGERVSVSEILLRSTDR